MSSGMSPLRMPLRLLSLGEPLTAQRVGISPLRLDRHTHTSLGFVPQKTKMAKLNAFGA